MIVVAARTVRALPLVIVSAALALLGVAVGTTVLNVPLVPQGLPASWLVALASANLLVIALHPAWGVISLTLPRNPTMWGAQLALACTVALGSYLPVALGNRHHPETTAWCILMAVAALAVATMPRLAWMPVTLIGIALEVMNGLTRDAWYRAFTVHEDGIRLLALVVFVAALAGVLVRVRGRSWYEQ